MSRVCFIARMCSLMLATHFHFDSGDPEKGVVTHQTTPTIFFLFRIVNRPVTHTHGISIKSRPELPRVQN